MLGLRGPVIDDLVQQVFLIVHRKGGFEVGPAKPMTWLRAIAVRVAADFRKSERRRRTGLDDAAIDEAAAQDASPEEAAALTQDLAGLERALASLSFDHRAVFVLFELERESFESIARILDIPTGTVGSRLSTARAKVIEQYRPKIASAKAPKSTSDPARIRGDPAAPEPLREDLDAAARASVEAGGRAEQIGHLLLHLGALRSREQHVVADIGSRRRVLARRFLGRHAREFLLEQRVEGGVRVQRVVLKHEDLRLEAGIRLGPGSRLGRIAGVEHE